jgi:hypothetical protein
MSAAVGLASRTIEADWEILHKGRRLQHRKSGVASARGQSQSVDAVPPDMLSCRSLLLKVSQFYLKKRSTLFLIKSPILVSQHCWADGNGCDT